MAFNAIKVIILIERWCPHAPGQSRGASHAVPVPGRPVGADAVYGGLHSCTVPLRRHVVQPFRSYVCILFYNGAVPTPGPSHWRTGDQT